MPQARLFHCTSHEEADLVEARGFIDAPCKGLNPGVWVSNYPVDPSGAEGDALFEILLDLPTAELHGEYEIVEPGRAYREFLIPARIMNDPAKCAFRRIQKHESAAADGTYWNEFPDDSAEPALKPDHLEVEPLDDRAG